MHKYYILDGLSACVGGAVVVGVVKCADIFGRFYNTTLMYGSGQVFIFVNEDAFVAMTMSMVMYLPLSKGVKKQTVSGANSVATYYCICNFVLQLRFFSAAMASASL